MHKEDSCEQQSDAEHEGDRGVQQVGAMQEVGGPLVGSKIELMISQHLQAKATPLGSIWGRMWEVLANLRRGEMGASP